MVVSMPYFYLSIHMKKIVFLCLTILGLLAVSCSGTNADGANENTSEGKIVKYVKKGLNRGVKLKEYTIVNSYYPIELSSDDFKKYRDAVFKAGLDYNACKVRGLQAGMESALSTINRVQESIKEIVDEYDSRNDKKEYTFLLGTIVERNVESYLIVAFDLENNEMIGWHEVTTPIQNNACMIVNALQGKLLDYALNTSSEPQSLADSVENPVVKFILTSRPK